MADKQNNTPETDPNEEPRPAPGPVEQGPPEQVAPEAEPMPEVPDVDPEVIEAPDEEPEPVQAPDEEPEPIEVECEVVWSREKTDDPKKHPVGMGVRFIKISVTDRQRLLKGLKLNSAADIPK